MNNFFLKQFLGRKTSILLKILRFNYLIVMSSIHLRRFKTNIFAFDLDFLIKELSTKDSGTIPKDLKNFFSFIKNPVIINLCT